MSILEAHLTAAISGAGLGIWTTDASTWNVLADARLAGMFGLPPEKTKLAREEWQSFVHPEDKARLIADLRAGVEGITPFTSEFRVIRSDGEERWLAMQGSVLRHPDGAPLRAAGVVQDITERKRAEVALRESEAEYRALFESLGRSHALTDPATSRFLRVNRALCKMTGYSAKELYARTVGDITHPDDRAADLAARERMVNGEDPTYEREKRYVRKDGAVIWVRVIAVLLRDAEGRPKHTVALIEDVTERKRAEERLKLLAAEVDHRAKNMLALVQIIVRQTRAASVGDFSRIVQGRVAALARAHTLLSESRWQGADLRRLIEEELAPYRRVESRVRLDGPPLELRPRAAQSFALAIHELTTNAARHGALSVPQGRLSVEWMLRWSEAGGPPVQPATKHGLGMQVIERSIGEQLGGKARFDWRPGGLLCELIVASDKLES